METITWKRHEYCWKSNKSKTVYVWRRTKGYVYEVKGKQRSPIMSLKKVRSYLKKYDITIKIG